jgi:hypothetical protein
MLQDKLIPLLLGAAVCTLAGALVFGVSTIPRDPPLAPIKPMSLNTAIQHCNDAAYQKAPNVKQWDITECLYHALDGKYPIKSSISKKLPQ